MRNDEYDYLNSLPCHFTLKLHPKSEGAPLKDYSESYNAYNLLVDQLFATVAKFPDLVNKAMGTNQSMTIHLHLNRDELDSNPSGNE
jgi:hypothetical protein